ncbi:hypothetical protein IHV25_06180 [Phaeovibrio sulfidiphilus]|uniref:Uncharacterized protein n=1 Tax=Phaeovibrio sulfidiphilus TaxID=1220600 RepID=A0A8J7CPN6_9PROT|nr:hypothetical protein [Phaeovibrio sulfidiphilus]MBE1237232.1 hypothetical protein [Phaeovibrio sulfidiphilus]
MAVDAVSAASRTPAAAGSPAAPSPVGAQEDDGLFDGLSFWDLLDVVNPLHHLPIVGPVYRHFSGDELKSGPRLAGGFLFGSWIGLAGSAFEVALQKTTGRDTGEHVFALFEGEPETLSASGSQPLRPAILGGGRDDHYPEGWGTVNPHGPTALVGAPGSASVPFDGLDIRARAPDRLADGGTAPARAPAAVPALELRADLRTPAPLSAPGASVGGFSPLAANVMAPPDRVPGPRDPREVVHARNASLPPPRLGGTHPGGLPGPADLGPGALSRESIHDRAMPGSASAPVIRAASSAPSPAAPPSPAALAADPLGVALGPRPPGGRLADKLPPSLPDLSGKPSSLPRSLTDGRTSMELLELRMQAMAPPAGVRVVAPAGAAAGASGPDRRTVTASREPTGETGDANHRGSRSRSGTRPSVPAGSLANAPASAPALASLPPPVPASPGSDARANRTAGVSVPPSSAPGPTASRFESDSALWGLQQMMRNLDTYRRNQAATSGAAALNTDV